MTNKQLVTMRRRSLAEKEAWIKVAIEAFNEIDKYIHTIDPSLTVDYGMPVDGVRKAFETWRKKHDRITNRSR